MRREIEPLTKQGLGGNVFYLDKDSRRVKIKYLGERILRRESSLAAIDFAEKAIENTDGFHIARTERAVNGAIYYFVVYYKILKREN